MSKRFSVELHLEENVVAELEAAIVDRNSRAIDSDHWAFQEFLRVRCIVALEDWANEQILNRKKRREANQQLLETSQRQAALESEQRAANSGL